MVLCRCFSVEAFFSTPLVRDYKFHKTHFAADLIDLHSGKKPFSALGVVHVFQRKHLLEALRVEYPAFRNEGGQPGSDGAGVVAFVRKHLIDIDVDNEDNNTEPVSDDTEYLPVQVSSEQFSTEPLETKALDMRESGIERATASARSRSL